ncbi:hypothetical protein [Paenibacillus sp. FJAT-26967]|uniref:hypothetical protein n=1 Tax=Paenibacillus sp. FJAT-26967 TaxID=1729690 RepID=UPI0008386568|nr:hypothetical protein [Paenibacillus sp. FJAT-26967]
MKKIKNTCLLTLCLFTCIQFTAVAAPLVNSEAFHEGYLLSGVSNVGYWEDPTVSQMGYSYFMANARADYAAISNANIGFIKASSESEAAVRFYANWFNYDWYGSMDAYMLDGTKDHTLTQKWYKCHVIMNDKTMTQEGWTNSEKHKTALHELGHVLSLKPPGPGGYEDQL